MSDNLNEERVNLDNPLEKQVIEGLLADNDLKLETVGYTVRITDYHGRVVGTGSLDKAIIKCVAVATDYQGSSVFSKIITHLLEILHQNGLKHCFVFTKPSSVQSFRNLGFKEIERAEPLIALMEYGLEGVMEYTQYLMAHRVEGVLSKVGAVVVNCNPFTLGHRYLIETAAAACEHLYVIVVQEDRSAFPFSIRFELIKQGTADLQNVTLIRGDKYVVSASTFPTYFLKAEAVSRLGQLQAELDVRIFGRHIAPALGITHRFVGTEDYCTTTAAYNQAMQTVLPSFDIEHVIIPRKQTPGAAIISASQVRNQLKSGHWAEMDTLVPATTLNFLKSDAARVIIDRIKSSDSRH